MFQAGLKGRSECNSKWIITKRYSTHVNYINNTNAKRGVYFTFIPILSGTFQTRTHLTHADSTLWRRFYCPNWSHSGLYKVLVYDIEMQGI